VIGGRQGKINRRPFAGRRMRGRSFRCGAVWPRRVRRHARVAPGLENLAPGGMVERSVRYNTIRRAKRTGDNQSTEKEQRAWQMLERTK
jgi:hypothetical protein